MHQWAKKAGAERVLWQTVDAQRRDPHGAAWISHQGRGVAGRAVGDAIIGVAARCWQAQQEVTRERSPVCGHYANNTKSTHWVWWWVFRYGTLSFRLQANRVCRDGSNRRRGEPFFVHPDRSVVRSRRFLNKRPFLWWLQQAFCQSSESLRRSGRRPQKEAKRPIWRIFILSLFYCLFAQKLYKWKNKSNYLNSHDEEAQEKPPGL